MKLILASTSPRRKDILGWLGIPFITIDPLVDEKSIRDKNPEGLAMKLAEAKARSVANQVEQGLVIGSDTVIQFEDKIIEKPENEDHQRELLYLQKGKFSTIISAVCIMEFGEKRRKITRIKKTKFRMSDLTDWQIDEYVKSGQGLYKGGGYGVQDENGMFINKLDGCFCNGVGFPVCLVAEMLKDFGVKVDTDVYKLSLEKTGYQC